MVERTPDPIRVLAIDDHAVVRAGIAAMIEASPGCALVGEADNGDQGVRAYRQLLPDVVLMDLQMPGMDGIAATKAIRAEYPEAKIIILTTFCGDAQAITSLKAGASGYLLKSALAGDLARAITEVHRGGRYLHSEVASEIAMHVGEDYLQDREIRTLELVAQGLANKQIAAQMSLTEESVKANLRTVFSKLNVKDRTLAAMVAIKRGFIQS